jgi:hypothetical protein
MAQRAPANGKFDRFRIAIAPDRQKLDRIYPALQKNRRRRLSLYAPHLRTQSATKWIRSRQLVWSGI